VEAARASEIAIEREEEEKGGGGGGRRRVSALSSLFLDWCVGVTAEVTPLPSERASNPQRAHANEPQPRPRSRPSTLAILEITTSQVQLDPSCTTRPSSLPPPPSPSDNTYNKRSRWVHSSRSRQSVGYSKLIRSTIHLSFIRICRLSRISHKPTCQSIFERDQMVKSE
jgi:hypothetical protein